MKTKPHVFQSFSSFATSSLIGASWGLVEKAIHKARTARDFIRNSIIYGLREVASICRPPARNESVQVVGKYASHSKAIDDLFLPKSVGGAGWEVISKWDGGIR